MTRREEWLPAKQLAGSLGKTPAWLYYHSKAADGPIQRRWGVAWDRYGYEYNVVEFNVADAHAWARGYTRGGRRGMLYPASVVQERLGTPSELAAIQKQGLSGFIRQCVRDALTDRQVAPSRRRLRVIAGGKA